jgi:uncharacterized membrane protein
MKINPFILAISASIFFVIAEILFKYIPGINKDILTFTPIMWAFGGLYGLIYLCFNSDKVKDISNKKLFYMAIIGLLIFLGNIVYWKSSQLNSNPGLNRSIFSTALILFLTFTSCAIFQAPINMKQIIGVIFVILGSTIIGIYSK